MNHQEPILHYAARNLQDVFQDFKFFLARARSESGTKYAPSIIEPAELHFGRFGPNMIS
ncbi:hypothetical protein HYR69_01630 [Candidatus Sumerlaeota bacterium]|nr:hypothetical protein [Candidatus Sumerlaeota bacterium]